MQVIKLNANPWFIKANNLADTLLMTDEYNNDKIMIIFYIARGFNTKLNAVILAQDK